jgi:hypothetical protein
MTHQRWTALLAGLMAAALLPAGAYAGAGGGPGAPGGSAGTSTTYCCTTWTAVETGRGGNSFTTFSGVGCTPIDESPASNRDACGPGQESMKCRGERYTSGELTGGGTVKRCFSP